MNIKSLGIDIAKNVFQLHGIDALGNQVLKKRLNRADLAIFVSNLSSCTIYMESCGGANYWARKFESYGHFVKLISPQFVKPFVKTNKNDANDAEAIAEAGTRPSMRFVPIKQVEHQDIQSIHRIRSRVIKNRTALINEIRGLNLEYGITIPVGALKVKSALRELIDDSTNELTSLTRALMESLYDELIELDGRIKKLNKQITLICKENERCKRLREIPGIGELTATALIASIPDINEFQNGRHLSAWLGLVPRQVSSGNKQVLLGISKRGDCYLRNLLIHGARSALSHYKGVDSKYNQWLNKKKASLTFNKAAVALANKNARIIFSLLKSGDSFDNNLNMVAA